MPLSSLCSKDIFIIFFAFLLCSEASLNNNKPNCFIHKFGTMYCTGKIEPLCASDGRTYRNECIFCREKKLLRLRIKFKHYGVC